MKISWPRLARAVSVSLVAFFTACTSPTPTPIFVTATPAPVGISVGEVTSEPFLPFGTPTLANPFATPVPPTGTPVPYKVLQVCMSVEPQTLYDYTSADRDGAWARAVVLETLRDGPIDHLNFEYQPVILEKLPTLKNGGAKIQAATVKDGETLVDAAGNIALLTAGVRYFDANGVEQTYDGGGSVTAMQMTATFRLKDGLKWEDGKPLTADDVLFGWQIARDPANTASDHYITNRMLDPVVLDSRTIQFTFLPGFKDTLYYARFPIPYPRHLYGQRTVAELAADENVNRRPLSFGPFVMKEWAPEDHLTVVENPNYYRAAEGLPRIDEIVFRFLPDAAQMVEAVKSGSCDIGLSPQESFFNSQFDSIDLAEAQGTLRSQYMPSTTFEHLDFNISPVDGYRGLAGTKLFEDVRVRKAFAYCINRREIIDVLLRGRSDVPAAYVPASHPDYDKRVTIYPFDPDQGRALLQEAGWRDTNGDGLLDKKGRLSLDYIFGPIGNTLRESIAALLAAQLKTNCGIEIKPRALSRGDFFGDFPDGVLFGRQYDLAQFAWVGGEDEPSCGLYTRNEWTGLGDGQPDQYGLVGYPGGGNNVGYINPTFDELCLRALNSLDPAEKKGGHQQAMRLFSQEVPSIILFFRPKIALIRPNVVGFTLDSTQESVLWNIETLDVIP